MTLYCTYDSLRVLALETLPDIRFTERLQGSVGNLYIYILCTGRVSTDEEAANTTCIMTCPDVKLAYNVTPVLLNSYSIFSLYDCFHF